VDEVSLVSQPLDESLSQSAEFVPQRKPHVRGMPVQVATALKGSGQEVHVVPQEFVLVSGWQLAPQRWKPGLQVVPQFVPSQVAIPFAMVVHGVQVAPHEFVLVFDKQFVPQRWKPVLQVKPQVPDVQVAVAFGGGAAQGEHAFPHEAMLSFGRHAPPQRWKPASQFSRQLRAIQAAVPFAVVGHAFPQVLQLCGSA